MEGVGGKGEKASPLTLAAFSYGGGWPFVGAMAHRGGDLGGVPYGRPWVGPPTRPRKYFGNWGHTPQSGSPP